MMTDDHQDLSQGSTVRVGDRRFVERLAAVWLIFLAAAFTVGGLAVALGWLR